MSVKSKEEIEEIFRRSRERKEKERLEQEKMKEQIKALEMKEYQKAYREKRKREKEAQRAKEQAQCEYEWNKARDISDIKWMEKKYSDYYGLYTKYELQHIEELFPEEEGRINWEVWMKGVEEGRRLMENFHTTTI